MENSGSHREVSFTEFRELSGFLRPDLPDYLVTH